MFVICFEGFLYEVDVRDDIFLYQKDRKTLSNFEVWGLKLMCVFAWYMN